MKKIFSKSFYVLVVSVSIFGLSSCKNESKSKDNNESLVIDRSTMDSTVNPSDDFYQYANGGWLKKNPVPSTEARWGSFNELGNRNREILKKIVLEASKNTSAAEGSTVQKLRDFYNSGMDSNGIDKLGMTPIEGYIKSVDEVKTIEDLSKLMGENFLKGNFNPFGLYVDQDAKQSDRYVLSISQGGTSLPEKDYYFSKDAKLQKIREEYVLHIEKMLSMAGMKSPKENAKMIMDLETKLADSSMSRKQMRDPKSIYNKYTFNELKKFTPNINWDVIIKEIGTKDVDYVIVSQPNFFFELNKLLKSVPLENWKTYIKYHILSGNATELASNFDNEYFHFFETVLSGTKENDPRWKRTLQGVDACLGEILGEEYVKVAFTPESKARMLKLVDNLRSAFADRIKNLDWMSPETKEKALIKLNKITVKIGYPDKWKDHKNLIIKPNDLVGNVHRAHEVEFKRMMDKLGKPIDRTEWGMTPPTVNAYYNPAMNEIVFPAGILQPPFFYQNGDDAINYGAIGAVIGHELTHGFDDEGRKFDADGNLKDWWTKEDDSKFNAKVQKLEQQFNNYIAIDTLHVDGKLTLGENLADLGGLTLAYDAYKKSLGGKEDKTIGGFTGDQRFYLAWAQGWRTNYRDEALVNQVRTNPHSPSNFRVLGPLVNLEPFQKAFGIKEGSKMYKSSSDMIKVW